MAVNTLKTPPAVSKWRVPVAIVAAIGLALGIGFGIKQWSEGTGPAGTKDASDSGDKPSDGKAETKPAEPQTITLSPEVMRKYGLRVGVARKRKLVANIIAPGRVAFNSEAMAVVGTPIQGRVVEIRVRAGDRVERGAELLTIESTELGEAQSDFLQKRAAAAAAKSAIEPSTSIYTRAKKLYEDSQGIGLTELQKREVDLRQAEGALATSEAARLAAENKLHLLGMNPAAIGELVTSGQINPRYVVKSPLSGEVIERCVNLGELVKPDREKLLVVADTGRLWVWADVPEVRAREVAMGCPAQITLTAAGEQSFTGAVSHIAPSIDDSTRSLRVRIEVKSDPALRPGMFAQAEINGKASGENAEPVLAVPETAIQTVNGSTAVFLPDKDNSNAFQPRLVSTGNYVDGMVGIISGLEEGERVVTAGSAILKAELLKASAKDED